MEKLDNNGLIKFLPNTLVTVRKEFGLDKPGVLEESLNVLEKWISEQKHFMKKDFSREDLERILINCKGSVEKTKLRLDKSCTIRRLLPQYFDTLDARADMEPYDNLVTCVLLPQLTNKHERIVIIRNMNYTGITEYTSCYKYLVKVMEYIKKNDYNTGVIVILDYINANLKHLIPRLNFVEMRHITNICLESYGLRIRKIYVLSPSRLIDTVAAFLKRIVTKKISTRIQVYKDYKKLHKDLPLEILPEEYEGPERCIDDLHEDFIRTLTSENFVDYLKEMKKAITNESLRDRREFNEAYLGAI